ncbi:MAG TPA: carboxypeptidase-like regulatory domain-containing protein [Vicinamibacterales bacterium]|nr:carboxypeptidase-like regulatory domain-containing protein [Vicinamibacterales bacterium]
MRTPLALAIVFAFTSRTAAQVVVPADGPPPGPRTGMIVGQVVDATTGAAVPEAIVRLSLPKYARSPEAPKGLVMADGDGRFFFADLPAGDYYMQATKDGYAPGTYGQRRASGQSQLLALGEGERLADLKLKVWKFGVIGGTVVDEAGEPVVGIAVRALIKDAIAGRTQVGSAEIGSDLLPSTITDDRGIFRLSRMMPGTYVVVVPSTQTTLPASALESQNTALRNELFMSGVQEFTLLGQPRTQQFGDAALMTLSSVTIPPPVSADGRMAMYRTTYYPAAPTAGAATPIVLASGDERTDLTISLRPVPSVRVTGRLVTPDGSPPPPTTIRLIGDAMRDVVTSDLSDGPGDVGFETVSGISDAAGRFTLLGVPPGEYVLRHAARFLSRATQQGLTAYWFAQPVTVGSSDISDLAVQVRPAFRVEGRFEFRHSAQAVPRPIPNTLLILETPYGEPGRVAIEGQNVPARSFASVAAGGQYLVRPYERQGWFVESITADGKDITDRVFDLQADMTSLVVTFTDKPSPISGTVKDTRGETSATAVVLAFPVDPRRWTGYGASPRTIKSALAARTGVYTFEHLPPGDYNLVAVEPADADRWTDPKRLEALASMATRVAIAAGDTAKTVDLVVKATR